MRMQTNAKSAAATRRGPLPRKQPTQQAAKVLSKDIALANNLNATIFHYRWLLQYACLHHVDRLVIVKIIRIIVFMWPLEMSMRMESPYGNRNPMKLPWKWDKKKSNRGNLTGMGILLPHVNSFQLRTVMSYSPAFCIQETHHEIRIPKRNVPYIVFSVCLLTLIHGYPQNRKQSH